MVCSSTQNGWFVYDDEWFVILCTQIENYFFYLSTQNSWFARQRRRRRMIHYFVLYSNGKNNFRFENKKILGLHECVCEMLKSSRLSTMDSEYLIKICVPKLFQYTKRLILCTQIENYFFYLSTQNSWFAQRRRRMIHYFVLYSNEKKFSIWEQKNNRFTRMRVWNACVSPHMCEPAIFVPFFLFFLVKK